MARDVVPRADGEGDIGKSSKHWLAGFLERINIFQYIDFLNTSNPPYFEGRAFWDNSQHTLSIYNENSEVTHNLGQEVLMRVYNETGSVINNGQPVYINGSNGEAHPTIDLGKADVESTSRLIGVALSDIFNDSYGYVTLCGKVHEIDTSSYNEGDTLYLSATEAGEFTTVKPEIAVIIGKVIVSSSGGGIIYVCINELGTVGADMLKSVYDQNDNAIVDKAEALNDGSSGGGNNVTAEEARDHIDNLDTDVKHVTDNQQDALDNANSPSASNPVITEDDIVTDYTSSEGESITTDTAWQQKLRLSFTPPIAGDYMLLFSCEITNSSATKEVQVQLEQDDTTQLNYAYHSPSTANRYDTRMGYAIVALDTNPHTFDLDFSRIGTVGTAKIRRARICIQKK